MGEIIDFQEAASNAGLKKVINGTAPSVSAEQISRYAAEGAALIRKQSGVTSDDIFEIKVNGITVYGIKQR